MSDLVKRVADAIYHRDSTDIHAIARVAIKNVIDDLREFNTDPWNDLEVKAFLDAYEKDMK